MKTVRLIQTSHCILLTLILGFGAVLYAQPANLVRVSAIMKTEHDDPKGSIAKVVQKHLEIEVSGGALVQGEVKITCTFFADDLAANKVVALKPNDLKGMLEAGKCTRLNSPVVSFNFTPQHSEKSGSGKRAKYKRVEAAGTRYHGWGIQIFRGTELVGAAFSNSDIKKRLER